MVLNSIRTSFKHNACMSHGLSVLFNHYKYHRENANVDGAIILRQVDNFLLLFGISPEIYFNCEASPSAINAHRNKSTHDEQHRQFTRKTNV